MPCMIRLTKQGELIRPRNVPYSTGWGDVAVLNEETNSWEIPEWAVEKLERESIERLTRDSPEPIPDEQLQAERTELFSAVGIHSDGTIEAIELDDHAINSAISRYNFDGKWPPGFSQDDIARCKAEIRHRMSESGRRERMARAREFDAQYPEIARKIRIEMCGFRHAWRIWELDYEWERNRALDKVWDSLAHINDIEAREAAFWAHPVVMEAEKEYDKKAEASRLQMEAELEGE